MGMKLFEVYRSSQDYMVDGSMWIENICVGGNYNIRIKFLFGVTENTLARSWFGCDRAEMEKERAKSLSSMESILFPREQEIAEQLLSNSPIARVLYNNLKPGSVRGGLSLSSAYVVPSARLIDPR